jgi:elongation factor G
VGTKKEAIGMPHAASRIRNVALVGHRGSGKTSLHEALLFEAGALTRLGSVADGTTVSDADEDEKARGMSISASLASFQWRDVKVNLIDTPGEPSFVADALGALRVCESAIFVVNGVMGVEVSTQRLWQRASELGVARLIYVNMLDRERADYFRTLESLKGAFGPHVVATEIPIGAEHEVRGVIDLVDMKAYEYDGSEHTQQTSSAGTGGTEIPIPGDLAEQAQEYREKLMDEVAENSEALMERYLEGDEISHEEIVTALEDGTDHGHIFPVCCGVATTRLGADRLLDAIVDDLPSPVQHGALEVDTQSASPTGTGELRLEPVEDAEMFAYVFKTRADPFAGRINLFRVYQGVMTHDTHVLNTRTHNKERIGQLLEPRGKDVDHTDAFGPGDIGAVAKLKETRAGDWLAAHDQPIHMPAVKLPSPVMAFHIEPKAKGDEDKVFTALRRLQEEDPTIDLHRDEQTGEQIVAGLSQIHVEVIVDRLKSRFGAEVELMPPRVPYQETIRGSAKAHGRHKKQSGGRGQFGDCHIEIEPLAEGDFEFVNAIKGGVIPGGFIPAVEKGVREAMAQGIVAGYPVKGVRVKVYDGSYHSVDSSEMAFKLAGSIAMKQALEQANPVLLEPIMLVTASVPEESVGDVMGDLSSRRGRPLGTEASAGMTEVKAEVPMSEMLAYAPDLRSITGGQGEFTMEFERYEEIPAHLAQKVAAEAAEEEVHA